MENNSEIIKELEDIKKEICQCIKHCPNENTDLEISVSIIEEHISKLKGKNK